MRTPRSLALALLLASPAALADVDADHPIVEDTGYTLRKHEVKIGLFQSSFGITERLQVDSYLFADLGTFFNAGLKYRLVDEPNLALALEGWAGTLLVGYPLGGVFFDWGAQVDASVPLVDKLRLHMVGGYRYWRLASISFGDFSTDFDGRIAWPTVKAALEYDLTQNHVFLLTLGTPTSWQAASQAGTHDFDATDFWSLTVGYQLSYSIVNARLDLGYGPSLLGRGITGSLDFYVRFNG